MDEKQETVADILAEMRGPKFYPWGQGGFSVEMDLTPLADRIEAAQKREVGNGAKMREALKAVRMFLDGYTVNNLELRRMVDAALAELPRNCDRFGTDNVEASLAYEEFCDRAEIEESVNGAISWLLSLDADKEGGAK